MLAVTCFAQTPITPVTAPELSYFKFMLTALARPNATQESVTRQENQLVLRFALNSAELSVIDSARVQVQAILSEAQQATTQITSGKTAISAADLTALASIDNKMDQQIAAVATGILTAVRSETAVRLRAPGDIVANGFAAGFSGTGVFSAGLSALGGGN